MNRNIYRMACTTRSVDIYSNLIDQNASDVQKIHQNRLGKLRQICGHQFEFMEQHK